MVATDLGRHWYACTWILQVAISLLGSIPSYIFYVILIVWFVYEVANDIVTKRTGSGILSTQRKVKMHCSYSNDLWLAFLEFIPFQVYQAAFAQEVSDCTYIDSNFLIQYFREDLPSNDDIWQRLKSFFWFYEKGIILVTIAVLWQISLVSDFRFPLRFLAPLVVMVSLNFRVSCPSDLLQKCYHLIPQLFFSMLSVADLFSPLVQHYTNIKNGAIGMYQ